MKACVVNLPWEENDKWGIRSGCRFPNLMPIQHNSYVPFPFFLAYTVSYLVSKGMDAYLIDAVAERYSVKEFTGILVGHSPDVIIAETSTASFDYDIKMLYDIKRKTGSVIVLFGPHVSALPEEALKKDVIDYVIRGEPELTSYELLCAIGSGSDIGKVRGVVYRDESGKVVTNEARPLIADIDSLPYPTRDESSMQKYSVPGFPSQVVFIYGSRGCPYKCNYCLWPQVMFQPGSYRPRSAEKIVEEMAWVLTRFPGTGSFFFDDDTFNIGRDRMLKFAQELNSRNIRIPWGVNARADNLDGELLLKLKKAGLFNLRIGIESGDREVLKMCGKGIDLDEAAKNLRIAHKLNIAIHLSFMVGLAEESWESVKNTVKFINSVPAESVQFSVAVPFPGTRYYEYVLNNGFLENHDWHDYNGSDTAVMRTRFMTAREVMLALAYVRKKVYFSPRFIINRLGYIRTLKDLNAIVRKAFRILKHDRHLKK